MGAALYLALATWWEIPVSSMLVMLGAIIGVSLAGQGFTSVYWNKVFSKHSLSWQNCNILWYSNVAVR